MLCKFLRIPWFLRPTTSPHMPYLPPLSSCIMRSPETILCTTCRSSFHFISWPCTVISFRLQWSSSSDRENWLQSKPPNQSIFPSFYAHRYGVRADQTHPRRKSTRHQRLCSPYERPDTRAKRNTWKWCRRTTHPTKVSHILHYQVS